VKFCILDVFYDLFHIQMSLWHTCGSMECIMYVHMYVTWSFCLYLKMFVVQFLAIIVMCTKNWQWLKGQTYIKTLQTYFQIIRMIRIVHSVCKVFPVCFMKECRESGYIALLILNLTTKWGWLVSFMPQSLILQGINSWYPWKRGLDGPQSQSGCFSEEKKSLVPAQNHTADIQPVA
jgi:hypothetical protein